MATARHGQLGVSPIQASVVLTSMWPSNWYSSKINFADTAIPSSNYECDSSPLKGDLNQYGSLGKLVMPQFMEVRSTSSETLNSFYG